MHCIHLLRFPFLSALLCLVGPTQSGKRFKQNEFVGGRLAYRSCSRTRWARSTLPNSWKKSLAVKISSEYPFCYPPFLSSPVSLLTFLAPLFCTVASWNLLSVRHSGFGTRLLLHVDNIRRSKENVKETESDSSAASIASLFSSSPLNKRRGLSLARQGSEGSCLIGSPTCSMSSSRKVPPCIVVVLQCSYISIGPEGMMNYIFLTRLDNGTIKGRLGVYIMPTFPSSCYHASKLARSSTPLELANIK